MYTTGKCTQFTELSELSIMSIAGLAIPTTRDIGKGDWQRTLIEIHPCFALFSSLLASKSRVLLSLLTSTPLINTAIIYSS